jgi:hypothetical protein
LLLLSLVARQSQCEKGAKSSDDISLHSKASYLIWTKIIYMPPLAMLPRNVNWSSADQSLRAITAIRKTGSPPTGTLLQ